MADRKVQEVVMSFDRAGDIQIFGKALVEREINQAGANPVEEVRGSGPTGMLIGLSRLIEKTNEKKPGAEVGFSALIDPLVDKARGTLVTPEATTPTVKPADKPRR